MVKQPIAGYVKTRLARDVGVGRATSFYRHATQSVISRLSHDTRWETVLAVAPDMALDRIKIAGAVSRIPQGGGDLGQRMARIMRNFPPGPVVIVGSDCLTMTRLHIHTAFKKLGTHDGVMGPALDGGFWLIGLKRFPRCPDIFNNVRWSSAHTRADTLRNMTRLRVAMLEPLSDVDTGLDLHAVQDQAGRRVLPMD